MNSVVQSRKRKSEIRAVIKVEDIEFLSIFKYLMPIVYSVGSSPSALVRDAKSFSKISAKKVFLKYQQQLVLQCRHTYVMSRKKCNR